jgi:2-hydroxy-6-oxonona-2,4-dienedioate hydrolase
MSIYTSPEAAERLRAWPPRFRARIAAPLEERSVATSLGETHVLVGGPADAPPLVVLHGVMASSAHVMAEVAPLLDRFRVYAPDVLGHSPLSDDTRPPLDQYGRWATEVLDGLGLGEVALCGVSYGGFVAIRAVMAAPERYCRLTLVVPGGLVAGSAWVGVTKLAVPMALYRWFPSQARLERFLTPQFTTLDPLWVSWLGDALLGFKMDMRVPPLATPEQLRGYCRPVQVFGASDDVHFPGPALLARAREVFPRVVDAELLDCKHTPPFDDPFRERLCGRIASFLQSADPVRDAL